jgi:microcystin-dependent protein
MGCSNCFNGCAEIVSDQCVKYTGIDVPVLGIKKGDSLSYVEQALIEFLTSTLDGTGIKIDVPSAIICELVQQYLPTCGDITVVDLITALIKAACDLQEQVDAVKADITALNADYTIGCLTGVTASSDTHEIVQAIINKLCALDVAFAAFVLQVTTADYVKKTELCSLVDDCIAAIPGTTQQYQKMVPYTVVEYYGPLSNFDGAGVGIPALGWDKIYICNGQVVNGTPTPDKRGRIGIGAILNVPGGGPLDPVVTPGPFSPIYALYGTAGANSVPLTTAEIPSHTHVATVTINDPGHKHVFGGDDQIVTQGGYIATGSTFNYDAESTTSGFGKHMFTKDTSITDAPQTTGLKGTGTDQNVFVTNATAGNGTSPLHDNKPPVLACYYIMYIP